jgi:hypothetical protein
MTKLIHRIIIGCFGEANHVGSQSGNQRGAGERVPDIAEQQVPK